MTPSLVTQPLPPAFAVKSQRVALDNGLREAMVVVEAGKIAAVIEDDSIEFVGEVIDYGDLVLGPGLVDAHVHINEPGRTDWEGFRAATAAAAAGGVTTLIDMPLNSSPVTTSLESLQIKRETAAGQCRVDVAFYGGLVAGGAGVVRDLAEAGVAGIKAFLCDSGLEEFPAAAADDLFSAAEALAPLGLPLLAHAELPLKASPTLSDACRYKEYLRSRPEAWEWDAIELLIRVCRETGCRVHVVHLANGKAMELTDAARAEDLPLTVETCPHYLHFAAEEIPNGATQFKCAPPIREELHREELWRGLAAGCIDTVGSDHSPCPPAMKMLEEGDFLSAWGGIAGLQVTLPVVATGAKHRAIPLEKVFQWTSRRPAELFGLGDRKGRIAVGWDADFVVFNPAAEWIVDAEQLLHRHKVTPYANQRLVGKVVETISGGQRVLADGRLVGEPSGRLLTACFS